MIHPLLKSLGIILVLFFAPIVPLLLLIGFAIVADTLFGVVASVKNKKPILSSKLARILTKSLIYMSLILLAYGIDIVLVNVILTKYFSINLLFTKFSGILITSVEVYSIDEKIRSFNDNRGIMFYIKMLLSKAKQITGSIKDVKSDIDELKK
jgi:hypothetical protein